MRKQNLSRANIIQTLINNIDGESYLEIGIGTGQLFKSIKCAKKVSVDPCISDGSQSGNRKPTFKMTSDDFFKKNSQIKFDVIFIDGLHEYEQCQRDCLNSIKSLNENGIILFHDFLPRSTFEENVPRKQSSWTGDVWKVAVELANSKNAQFKIINIDMGIGVLKIKNNFEYKKMKELKNKSFKEYLDYKNNLSIISSQEGINFISDN